MSLQGEVYGHPLKEDGKKVTTSYVVEKLGPLTYKTYSGTIYELEDVSPDYVEWCSKNYPSLDIKDPIKLILD